MPRKRAGLLKWPVSAVLALLMLYLVWAVLWSGQFLVGLCLLAGGALAFYTYLSARAYTWRYLFPGIAGILVFVILPVAYTVRLGFTNYSSRNLLTFERATSYLLEETVAGKGRHYTFTVHADGDGYRLLFRTTDEEAGEGEQAEKTPPATFATSKLDLAHPGTRSSPPPLPADPPPGPALPLKEVIKLRAELAQLEVTFPDGTKATMASLREFAPLEPAYQVGKDRTLVQAQTGLVLTPDFHTGFYTTSKGEPVRPGFKVDVGFANYVRVATDPDLAAPLLRIFLWTVIFAGLTVLFTVVVGMTLAVVLNWEALQLRTLYRTYCSSSPTRSPGSSPSWSSAASSTRASAS